MNALLENNLRATVSSAEIVETILPLCPQIRLQLLSENYPRGPLPHDEMLAILNRPAYWAFCWASGQVLARYILENSKVFRDKVILDFGAGSGVVGIAAAMAGARQVIACDIDPMALDACMANADLNGVAIELLNDFDHLDKAVDMIIAADVLYDRDNLPFVEQFLARSNEVLIADSRLKKMEPPGYELLGRVTATTVPDLDEHREFTDVRIYRYTRQCSNH